MIETISQFASPDARRTRADALRLARKEGFHYCKRDKRHKFHLGKFEGESFEVLYFWDAMMNGFGGDLLMHPDADEADGEVFELSDIERQAFNVSASQTHAVLFYSSQGFVTLTYATAAEVDKLLAEYEEE